MKRPKASRALAVFMAVVMALTMTTTIAFGEDSYGTPKTSKNLLVFGASTSSGYGLSDYVNNRCGFALENNKLKVGATEDQWTEGWSVAQANAAGKARISNTSYPWQLKEYIAKKEFGGDLSKVHLSSIALNGMRTNELRAFLDEDYYRKADQIEKEKTWMYQDGKVRYCGFLGEHIDSFVADMGRAGATVDGVQIYGAPGNYVEGNDIVTLNGGRQGIYIKEDGTIPQSYYRAQKYIKQEIENADVVVVDCAMNNFGTYLAERVAGYAKTPGYETKFGYWKQSIDDIDGVSDRTWSAVKVLKKELLEDSGLIESETAQQFADAFIYCYADCVTNFSACVEKIREINPNAKIIAQGVYNTLDGINLVVDGQTIDFGGLSAKGFALVNAYIKGLDKNSPNYYYSDVSGGIETFMNQMVMAESLEELTSDADGESLMNNMYTSFKESFMQDMIEDQAKAGIAANAGAPSWDALDKETQDYLWATYGDAALAQANAVVDEQYGEKIRQMLFDASHYTTIDLDRIMKSMASMKSDDPEENVMSQLAGFITDETGEAELSGEAYELLHIVDRFMLYMGIGQHPSKLGCEQMTEDILAAYDKLANGGYTAFEEVFSKYYPYLIGAGLKIKEAYDNGDFDKMMKLMSKMDEISEMLEVIDESGLTADQLRELVQMKGELEARVGEILDYLGLTMDDVKAMLDENSSPEQIAEYINKFQQIKAVLDVIDEEGLTADQLKEALQLKKDLEKRMNETLDALGITMDELLAALDENATPEKIQEYLEKYEQISAVLAIIDEEGLTAEQLKEFFQIKKDVEARLNAALDILGIDMEELIKLLDENTTPEKIAEYAEQIQAAMEILQNLPTMDQVTEQLKAEIWKQIEQAQQMIEQRAAEISEELAAQIREISEMLKNAYEQGDYQEIIDQLMPIGEQLLAIGEAVYGLPEYEAAMNEYMETSNAAMAGLEDRVAALEQQMGKLTAKCIDVETAAKITFPKGSVSATLSWPVDEDAAGYILKKDGKEVNFAENEAGMIFEDPDVQIGETYKYEITPYIYWGDNNDIIYGKTFTTTVVPKVKLAKAKIKSVKAAKKAFTAKWKAVKNADGYQISYKVGKKTKKATVKGAKKLSKKVKKLQSKKKYTVKVRAYKKVDGTKYYGGWSKAKKVKIK